MSKVVKIIFRSKIFDEDNLINIFDIVNHLYWNGQILNNPIIEEEKTRFIVTVSLTQDESLEEEYWPRDIEKIKKKFHIDIIEGDSEFNYCEDGCSCGNSDFYIINPFMISLISPILCGNCLESIPLYKLDGLNCEDRYEIVHFSELYESINSLKEYDPEYHKNHLNNSDSKITNLGIEISKKIERKTSIPTYYFLLTTKNVDFCPKCGGKLDNLPIDITKYSEHGNINRVCKKCNLAFKNNKIEN